MASQNLDCGVISMVRVLYPETVPDVESIGSWKHDNQLGQGAAPGGKSELDAEFAHLDPRLFCPAHTANVKNELPRRLHR